MRSNKSLLKNICIYVEILPSDNAINFFGVKIKEKRPLHFLFKIDFKKQRDLIN